MAEKEGRMRSAYGLAKAGTDADAAISGVWSEVGRDAEI